MPNYVGDVGGLAFSPYHRGETPEANKLPTLPEIRQDLQLASGITSHIRTYSVQGDLAAIPRLAADYNMKVTLGAWIDTKRAADEAEVQRLIATANANPDVERVLVGNEVTYRGDVPVPQLIQYINEVKAGVHVPVSTARAMVGVAEAPRNSRTPSITSRSICCPIGKG